MSDSAVSKAVLITDCSTGIGRATADRLARGGWKVYATARRPETIEDLCEAGCRILPLDVTDEESMRTAVAKVVEEAGAVGVLVNNAGYGQSGAIETVPMQDVRRQFETNVFGLVQLTQLVLPGMREQGWGKVINLSSMGGRLTFPGGGFYHATKHAVEALSDALRFEVRGFGIDVVIIEPGLIRTQFSKTSVDSMEQSTSDEGPYDRFHVAVGIATREVYEKGGLSYLGGGPESVAKTVERAITARRPKARYPVTPSARVLLMLRTLLSDGMWDAFLKTNFPQPGKK